MTRPSYHHGALREALLTASLKLIEADGLAALSLRRVAREAGVSPGAPYHHYKDRAAVLAALAAQGFRMLADDLIAATSAAANPVEALSALIRAYVAFAQRQPAYFRLMFRPELSESRLDPEAKEAEHAAEACLESTVTALVDTGKIAPAQAKPFTVLIWSLGHGLASLWLDGHLSDDYEDPAALTTQITALVESALNPKKKISHE
ncbi:MAG TPA: TetR/AcrR family transcriptional regulator [Streptosporangiaceae bacterium]|nr:TetR/AcrR family transcriptional regulator [Streptosporangiaceae bacterium]